MVRIDAGALEPGQVMRASFDEGVDSGSSELILDAPVRGHVDITRTQLSLHARGTVGTVARMVCSRCLTEIRRPLQAAFDEEFLLRTDDQPGAEEAGLHAGPEPVLDVTEVVRQHLLLAAPMAPLCSSGCKGLCPVCGVNRNDVDCGHDVRPTDSRWAPLAKLKIERSDS